MTVVLSSQLFQSILARIVSTWPELIASRNRREDSTLQRTCYFTVIDIQVPDLSCQILLC